MQAEEKARLQAKTAEQRFLNILMQEFNYAPKVAQAILEEAQACLLSQSHELRPGQMRQVLLKRDAPHGQAVQEAEMVEVRWTIDAGAEDYDIAHHEGQASLRRVRLQRLAAEAVSQGAVATQEDLAHALHVSVRTIKRDCAYLQAQGVLVPTRGKLQGIGRGQTHKALIVGEWLRGATYDQIARRTHHSLTCVRRYIQAFVRVISLQRQGMSNEEIGLVLQMTPALVAEYLAVYEQHNTPFCRQRLQEQLEHLTQASPTKKAAAPMDHRYVGVHQRSFQNAVVHLLETDYGVLGSRRVLEMLAEDVGRLAREFHPAASCVPSGWLVFTGTKVTGRKAQPGKSAGDYPLVTLSWPVLLAEDVQALLDMPPGRRGRQKRRDLLKRRVQRLIEHGLDHPQGPVTLTLADLSLMLGCSVGQMSRLVNELRQETGQALPTKGYFFDQGMRPSHKAEIIALYEQGWDEAAIARQTQHAQPSVGRYLRDYERVKLLLKKGLKIPEIAPIIDMRPSVLEEYIALIQQYHPELLNDANTPDTT